MVSIDRTELSDNVVELSCLRCGKRWEIKTGSNPFGYWVVKQERKMQKKANGIG